MKARTMTLIGFVALLLAAFGTVAVVADVASVNLIIPGIDPHIIPGIDPH